MHKIIRFLFGAMFGALLAVVFVLLLTPITGVDLREKMTKLYRKIVDEIMDAGQQKKVELEAQIKQLSQPKHM